MTSERERMRTVPAPCWTSATICLSLARRAAFTRWNPSAKMKSPPFWNATTGGKRSPPEHRFGILRHGGVVNVGTGLRSGIKPHRIEPKPAHFVRYRFHHRRASNSSFDVDIEFPGKRRAANRARPA